MALGRCTFEDTLNMTFVTLGGLMINIKWKPGIIMIELTGCKDWQREQA